jgi:hypothetical protein
VRYRRAELAMAARPAMHAARRVQPSRTGDGEKPSPTLRFLFLFIFNRSKSPESESSAPQCYPRIGDMQTSPKSRGPSGFHAILHTAQPGVLFLTVGAQTFGCHTSGGVRRIGRFASQNLPPSPQPKAGKGLTHAREIPSTLGFCVTTPPAPRPAAQAPPVMPPTRSPASPPLRTASPEAAARP